VGGFARAGGRAFLAIGISVIALAAFMQARDRDFYSSAQVVQGVVTETVPGDKNAPNQR
jgi:hypothetical protein